jgi:acyl carrier protein
MSTLETLTDILVRDYGVTRASITPDATLATLALDSLSLLELMFKIEDRYALKITVGDVVRFIDGLLARTARSTGAVAEPQA